MNDIDYQKTINKLDKKYKYQNKTTRNKFYHTKIKNCLKNL